jgi:hypothetical protein
MQEIARISYSPGNRYVTHIVFQKNGVRYHTTGEWNKEPVFIIDDGYVHLQLHSTEHGVQTFL